MFRKTLSIVLVLMQFSVASSIVAFADEPEKIEKVIVTGVGTNADKARQNAIRNAVEQVVGTYISADTMVKDSALIKDEILSYSGGYVKESKIISTDKDDDLVKVKLEALVVSTKLKRKIQSLNIAVKDVEGASLFSEAFSKMEEKKAGGEVISRVLSKYPQAAYRFEVNKPQIKSTDYKSGKVQVIIPIIVKWDDAFLGELRNAIVKVSKHEIARTNIMSFRDKYCNGNNLICFSPKSRIKHGMADMCVALDETIELSKSENNETTRDKNEWNKDRNRTNEELSIFNPPVSAESMSLSIIFKDKAGRVVDTVNHIFQDGDSYKQQNIKLGGDHAILTAVLNGEGFLPPNLLWRNLRGGQILVVTDGKFIVNASAEIEVNALRDITRIEISMNGWK